MVCVKCSNWKCEDLTLAEFKYLWSESIGGEVTPGISLRYKKKAAKQGVDISEIRIGFKYCAEGIITRFYIKRRETDCQPMRSGNSCPKFTEDSTKMERISLIWPRCATESHGPSLVNGIRFTPGLYENNTYMRIPLYGSVKPMVERGDTVCSVCGKKSQKSIRINIEKSFCCNRHYLEWWAKRYREECQKLSPVL